MSLRYGVIVFGRFTNQRDGSFGLLWTNPDVDVLSFESFFVSLHCWNGFGGSYYFFFKITKISFQHFFIMNNTPGNAQRQGAEPHRASTLNAISNPKPQFHSKHSNFWFAHAKSKPKEPSLWFAPLVCGDGGAWDVGEESEPRREKHFSSRLGGVKKVSSFLTL